VRPGERAIVGWAQLFASQHQRDQFVLVELAHTPGADQPAVAKDGDAVADREDLVQAVRHVDDAETPLADAVERRKQGLDLFTRK